MGFAVTSFPNILIPIILHYLGLLNEKLYDEIINVQNFDGDMLIAGRCTAWQVAIRVKKSGLPALGVCRKLSDGTNMSLER